MGRKKRRKWKFATGHRSSRAANKRKKQFDKKLYRKDQEFRVKQVKDARFPWEVQFRRK